MAIRILYIEDDGFVAAMVKRAMEADGFEVDVVDDGLAGEAKAKSGGYDLILMDHNLPGKDGVDILRDLKPGPGRAPVIMVSGSSELSVAVEAMRIGAADFVIKETDGSYLDLLPRTVNRVLDHMRLVQAKRRADERIAEQAAIIQGVLDNMDPGVTLFDADLKLAAWNDRMMELFDLPRSLLGTGVPLIDILSHMASKGEFSSDEPETMVAERIDLFRSGKPFQIDHARPNGQVIEIRGGPMPREGFIASYTDITERKRMEEELRRLATTDPLTGVNNRRRFTELSEREIARCRRYGRPLSVLMLDADHFKKVNDTYGHDIGDLVLKALARTCASALRDTDVLARFGGEEFVITLPDTPPATAADTAERLRASLAAVRVPLSDGQEIGFTVSIGIATLQETDSGLDDILVRADEGLYRAKEEGRNRVVVA